MSTGRLQGKTAVVTGGGSGIGEGIARALAADGARVIITGRSEAKLRTVAESVKDKSAPPIQFRTLDVADRNAVNAFFEWATATLGHVDILVNSAGTNIVKRSVAELDPADWDQLLAVNATGAYNCIHAVLPQMRERHDGLIINISSVAGVRASVLGGVAYTASKFALASMSHVMALEEKDNGIRITNVHPGEVETPLLDTRPVPVSAEHRSKILQPEDIAVMVVAIACLPPRAHVSDILIKPTTQPFA
jgi:NADP-dependent 3-hydroxy acid dehydrogenase YdfG